MSVTVEKSCSECRHRPVPGLYEPKCSPCAPGVHYINFEAKPQPRRVPAHTLAGADATQVGGNHYKDMAVQPWSVMETLLTREEFIGFLKGNYLKYSMRAGKKEGSDDLGKAEHYSMKLKEVLANR